MAEELTVASLIKYLTRIKDLHGDLPMTVVATEEPRRLVSLRALPKVESVTQDETGDFYPYPVVVYYSPTGGREVPWPGMYVCHLSLD